MHFLEFGTRWTSSAGTSEALILVAASGYSYEDAAKLCACAVGTVKSRVNRGTASNWRNYRHARATKN